ncbi:MAG: helix-turn-helix transcriptional regulator [Clostridia bacterium]|nr:helix-turn-helix transcriptional regulator [Clostridia bacterium]
MFRFRLKELRDKRGYSQAALANKIGVKQSTVGMWENGTNYPKVQQLITLADLFHASVDYLLGRDEYIGITHYQKQSEVVLSDEDKKLLSAFHMLSSENRISIVKNIQFLQSIQNEEKDKRTTIA